MMMILNHPLPILLLWLLLNHNMMTYSRIHFHENHLYTLNNITNNHNKLNEHIDLSHFIKSVNQSLNSTIDSSVEHMSTVYHSGNICPFKRNIYSKMMKGDKINILIIGGSVTYGADLPDRIKQRWSTKFISIMNSGWYHGIIDIRNIGVGACNIDVWIYRVNEMKDYDMIIVDLSPNDQGFDLQALPHLYRTFIHLIDNLPHHPALYFHESFRTGAYNIKEYNHCKNKVDQGMCCNGFLYCRRWWDMQDFVSIPLHKYKVPYISYRDLIWPDYYHPPSNLNEWWNGASHPDYRAHRMIGKLIAYGFLMQLKEAQHSDQQCDDIPVAEQRGYVSVADTDVSIQSICNDPLTTLYAGETLQSVSTFQPHSIYNTSSTLSSELSSSSSSSSELSSSSSAITQQEQQQSSVSSPLLQQTLSSTHSLWRYFNDSQLKFGWILTTTAKEVNEQCGIHSIVLCSTMIERSEIIFKIKLSEQPKIQISYLKSYTGYMGVVAVWVDSMKNESIHIDGNWDSEYSVTNVITIVQRNDFNLSSIVVGNSKVMPGLSSGEHLLHIAIPSNTVKKHKFKWKLIGITTC